MLVGSDVVSVFRDVLVRLMREDKEKAGRKRKYRDERVLFEGEVNVLVEFFKKAFEDEKLDVLEGFRGVLNAIKVES